MQIKCSYSEMMPVDELRRHPKNPNRHTPEQIKRLAKILKYQGWRRPIRVSNLTHYITAGHGALEAAKLNEWEEVPVDYQDYDNEEMEFADLVADNSIAAWADLDLALVNVEIENLGPDLDIELLGIDGFEIEPADKLINEKEINKTVATERKCPSCGHEW